MYNFSNRDILKKKNTCFNYSFESPNQDSIINIFIISLFMSKIKAFVQRDAEDRILIWLDVHKYSLFIFRY